MLRPKSAQLMPLVFFQGHRRISGKQRSYEVIQPQKVDQVERRFPARIPKPGYFQDGGLDFGLVEQVISCPEKLGRNEKTIQGVQKACQLAKRILQETSIYLRVSWTTMGWIFSCLTLFGHF